MHSWLRALCTVCLAVIIPTCVFLGAEGHPQAMELEVKAVEQRWLDNENRSDVVQSILANDFVYALPIGFISKDDHLAYLRQHPNAFPGTKRFEELRVKRKFPRGRIYRFRPYALATENSVSELWRSSSCTTAALAVYAFRV